MDIPINISTGMVTGRYIADVIDGTDAGSEPDVIPVQGKIVFMSSVEYLPVPTAIPGPVTIMRHDIVGVLDSEGYLCTPMPNSLEPQYRGVKLIANDNPDIAVQNWTWDVTYLFDPIEGKRSVVRPHGFFLPGGTEVDLTLVAKVPSSPGYSLPQAEAAALRAENAAAAAAGTVQEMSGMVVEALGQTLTTGSVEGDNLFLLNQNGAKIDAGNVRGAKGDPGSNTVPTAEAIATEIQTPGSLANTALSAAIDERTDRPLTLIQRQQIFAPHGPGKLSRWKTALAARDTANVPMLCLGDSNTEGQGATSIDKRWTSQLAKMLRSKYPTAGIGNGGGFGYLSSDKTGVTTFAWPTLLESNGGSFQSGSVHGAKRVVRIVVGAARITMTVRGTSLDVAYFIAATGVLRVTVDGGTPVTKNTYTPGGGFKDNGLFRVPLGASGLHSIVIDRDPSGSVGSGIDPSQAIHIEGVVVYDGDENRGISVHEVGQYGWNTGTGTTGWTRTGFTDPITNWPAAQAALKPALVIITLGTNDVSIPIAAGDYKTNLGNLIGYIRAAVTSAGGVQPSFLLHQMPARNTYDEAWPAYVNAAKELAEADKEVAYFDQSLLFQKPTSNAEGMWAPDMVHLSNHGHFTIAADLAAAL